MSMRWRARVTSLSFIPLIVVIALTANRGTVSSSGPIAAVVALIVAAYGMMYFGFRCPHCHARQLRGRWDWWLVGTRCRECSQLLDGPAVPEEQLYEEMLRDRDPAKAEALRQERLAFEALVEKAPHDPSAARQLEAELTRRVENMTTGLAQIRREEGDDRAVASFQRILTETQAKLAWCRSLGSRVTDSKRAAT